MPARGIWPTKCRRTILPRLFTGSGFSGVSGDNGSSRAKFPPGAVRRHSADQRGARLAPAASRMLGGPRRRTASVADLPGVRRTVIPVPVLRGVFLPARPPRRYDMIGLREAEEAKEETRDHDLRRH